MGVKHGHFKIKARGTGLRPDSADPSLMHKIVSRRRLANKNLSSSGGRQKHMSTEAFLPSLPEYDIVLRN